MSRGSPPHTWRIHENKSLLYVAERITSTHVENTVPAPLKTAIYLGSPPHTWRIHSFAKNHAIVTGITSTHVENTVVAQRPMARTRDHLHTRGEYNMVVYLW